MNSRSKARRSERLPSRARQSPAEPEDHADPMDPEELQEQLLEQIVQGGRLCKEVERQLKEQLCPELETIIKLYRVLVLKLSGEAQAMPDRAKLLSALMRPVMEWARLEEKRKQRELVEQKYREEAAARQAATTAQVAPKVLTPETLEKIEHELKLL